MSGEPREVPAKIEIGERALSGKPELIKGIKIFPEVNYDRNIEVQRGSSVQIYDPTLPTNTAPYWEVIFDSGKSIVPAGYVVKVMKATVLFI